MTNEDKIETLQTLFEDVCDDARNATKTKDIRKMRDYIESIEATLGELKQAIK